MNASPTASSGQRRRGLRVNSWTMIVVAIGVASWLAVLVLMSGMDDGPGTQLHELPIFLLGWTVMLTAMMLPSELNYVGAFGAVLKARGRSSSMCSQALVSFISGYGIAWIAYGFGAYVLDFSVRAISPDFIAWNRAGPQLAGAILIGAGFYQLSTLKHSCLRGCRSPLAFFARHWQEGNLGAVAMGARHGLVCVGCCWALMAVMFAVGAMSLTWMALLTAFMFAEKVLPKGRALTVPIAIFLWAMGLWIALSPDTAPLLKDPMIFGSVCKGLF